jgi:hypothetical protein
MMGRKIYNIWRAPRRFAASPTQPYKCGQYFKVKVKTSAVLGFNVLTALKGWLGHAPQGRGALLNFFKNYFPKKIPVFSG